MFVPATFVTALIMTILSTICWGSFANTYKLTKNYRFELYYWDYAGGIVLISLVLAFTLGAREAIAALCRRRPPSLRWQQRRHTALPQPCKNTLCRQ